MFCGFFSLRRHLRRRTCRPRFISYGARTSGRNSALPIERTAPRPPDLSGREQTFDASVFQLAGGSEDPIKFDVIGTAERTTLAAEIRQGALELQCTRATAYDRTRRSSKHCALLIPVLSQLFDCEAPTAV